MEVPWSVGGTPAHSEQRTHGRLSAIEVGTPITRRPPHRSLRAVFSHRAPQNNSPSHGQQGFAFAGWLVAVPTTVAPAPVRVAAMAAPMPRDAPVTNAISPASASDV